MARTAEEPLPFSRSFFFLSNSARKAASSFAPLAAVYPCGGWVGLGEHQGETAPWSEVWAARITAAQE